MRNAVLAVQLGSLFLIAGAGALGGEITQGALRRVDRQGRSLAECPLKHTAVNAETSGMLARVNVVQEFQNPFSEKIEAVYVFPLPHDAAVDQMTMLVGGRVIHSEIKRREEARALYEAARDAGKVAGLLDQERPNIFTQSVANILPGDSIKITISYVQVLRYEEGSYEFAFPMVVGPRYIPSNLPDAGRITPPVVPEGTRAGHDISVEVTLDAGLTIGDLDSKTHPIDVQRLTPSRAQVRLRDQDVIPNKDFILRYETAGQTIQDAVLAHRSQKGGFFTLILQPPERAGAADASPKELIFVLDTSGSMMGFPIEKAKEAMKLALDGLYSQDTFNLITFSGDTAVLFPEPVPATPANLAIAQLFLASRSGRGGTEMMKAIRAALEPVAQSGRVRVVCFMTDGYVGNDMEILAEVQRHPEARVFAFGIGQSVNRFLLDGMAAYGRGEVEYVGLKDDGSAAARRFDQRVRDPLLTDITIDWGALPVADVYPKRIPDLFGAKPVIVTGRYAGPARGVARLRGNAGGRETIREIALDLPAVEAGHDVLASLWARNRIADLMSQDLAGAQRGAMREGLRQQITQLGLDYRLMTQFTSFVAVEEVTVTRGGRPQRVEVPLNMPEGVSYEGVFGPGSGGGTGSGSVRVGGRVVGGQAGGVIGGVFGSAHKAVPPPPPPPPQVAMSVAVADQLPPAEGKLDPALAALLQAPDKTTKVEVQVLLRDTSAATLEQLKKLGFEVLRPAGRDLQVTGRIAIGQLEALARLEAVRYVVRSGPEPKETRGSLR